MFEISINITQLKFQIDLEAKSETCMKNNIKLVKFLPSIESSYVFIIIIFFMKSNSLTYPLKMTKKLQRNEATQRNDPPIFLECRDHGL